MATRRSLNYPARVTGESPIVPPGESESDYDRRQRLQAMQQRLEQMVHRLGILAQDQVTKKNTVEQRWLTDLRQYHGRYEASTEIRLKEGEKSRLFVNQTRAKVHGWEAKLTDMLFPSDEKNWGIKPTPVPELQSIIEKGQPDVVNMANIEGEDADRMAENSDPRAEQAKIEMEEARAAATAMEHEINDQLTEARYQIKMRRVIHDACKLGPGVLKGPVTGGKQRRRWRSITDESGGNVFTLQATADLRPTCERVDPWQFFPDLSGDSMESAGFTFERHLYNETQVRKLAKIPGFNHDELRKLIVEKPHEAYPTYIPQLREIVGAGQDTLKERFHVWEYHGPLDSEDILAVLESTGRVEEIEDFIDPLQEINVIVWFCQGHLLKFAPHPMESGDSLYSVFNFEDDDTCVFGFGVPYLMRDSQAAINGAWRMTMDNAGLSAGPQVLIDQNAVNPADGKWEMAPRKVWWKIKSLAGGTGRGGDKAFELFNITNNQQELVQIINMAMKFADDETSLPMIEQRGGDDKESASHVTRTALGMAIMMNAINVVFRRVVKNFDDQMTTPTIIRFYDFNMQFSEKENIKGDFEVDARGSSVLLVREMQAQNLMIMADKYSAHPVLGKMTKTAALYRKAIEAQMLSHSEIVMSDTEIAEAQQREAEKGKQNPELMKLEVQMQIAQIESDTKLQLADIERQTAMVKLATEQNIRLDDIRAKLQIADDTNTSKERILAAEAALEERKDARGDTSGSGGYV